MSVEYLEITDISYVPECVEFQKKVFSLSESDAFPASFFSLLIRKDHPVGMLVGCFKLENGQRKLIGLATNMVDKKPASLYCLSMGILPEYQKGRYGYNLTLALRSIALKNGYTTIFGIYDPLEANLGKLYCHIGVDAYKYITSPYKLDLETVTTIDKVLFEWKIDHKKVEKKLNRSNKVSVKELIRKVALAGEEDSGEDVRIEVPSDYQRLKINEPQTANNWRTNTQKVFDHYINKENYIITNCISEVQENTRKTYYILSKN